MKSKIFLILICNLIICSLLFAQNITNTLGSSGLFSIKDGSTTYLSLSQSTGYLSINRSITLPYTTSSTTGVIYKGADRFIHNYGINNLFLGQLSGNFSLTGTDNTAVGGSALTNLSSGNYNSAIGSSSLALNNIGYRNTALGFFSCSFNRSGHDNVAIGTESMLGNLFLTDNINYNTAVGSLSLYSIISGRNNSAVGFRSLYSNTTGIENSAFGESSLLSSNGNGNTAIGVFSGSGITTGDYNIVVGYNAQVPSGTGSNQVRIGQSTITYAGIQVAWTITSDRKWKENIVTSPLGLKFITRLNPVSYIRKNDESKKTEYGLIAQEVEEVLKEEGAENSAMITVTDEGNYELRYNDLLAPMIKAIQELNEANQKLKIQNQNLEERLAKLEKLIQDNYSYTDLKLTGK